MFGLSSGSTFGVIDPLAGEGGALVQLKTGIWHINSSRGRL